MNNRKSTLTVRLLAMCLMLLCVACNTDVHKIAGDYSYKQSGLVTFTDEEGQATSILANKQGQMNILEDKKGGKGAIIVTFNEMNGGAYTCNGTIKGDSIFFAPHEFSTRFSSADSVQELAQLGKVYTVQGTGRGVFRNEMIIMEESWIGHPEDGSLVRMFANKITLLAEEN